MWVWFPLPAWFVAFLERAGFTHASIVHDLVKLMWVWFPLSAWCVAFLEGAGFTHESIAHDLAWVLVQMYLIVTKCW